MSNPLFNAFNRGNPRNNPMEVVQQFMNFRNSFQGDARQQCEQFIQQNNISQQQLNHAQQMANKLQQVLRFVK